MVKKPGLLFISYYFPPTKSIACIRNYNICAELISRYSLHVFTTSNASHFAQDTYPPLALSSKKFLRTFDIRTIVHQKSLKSRIKKGNASSFVYRLLNSFPFNVFLGIGGIIYLLHGLISGSRTIRKEQITTLYSSYFPYSDHLICYFLKRWNPRVIWIADFRDLHYFPGNTEILFPKLQRWFNKKILQKADIVQTVSHGLQKHLTPFHNRVIVVRNSIGNINYSTTSDGPIREDGRFRISYTGNIIPGQSNPEKLFNSLQSMKDRAMVSADKLLFTYAGAYKEKFDQWGDEFGISELMETHDLLPFSEAREIQLAANVNVLLSFNYPALQGILTGKFYEYLYAQKPILLIINGSQDPEFEELFNKLNCGLIVYHQEVDAAKKIERFLTDLIKDHQEGNPHKYQYNSEALQQLSTSYQLQELFNFLQVNQDNAS